MKIATFNVNSIRKRLPIVLDWLDRHKPDVLCLQETKVQDTEFPLLALAETGYEVSFRGIKGYNGVAVLSRVKPDAVFSGFDDGGDPEDSRLMRVVIRGIPIVNTYVPQGYEIDSPKYAHKLKWFERLRRYFAKHLSPEKPAVWCGDMNVAPRPIDVHSPEKHLKHVCYHEDARKAYERTVKWGWQDVFVKLYPDRRQYTFWDIARRVRWKQTRVGALTISWPRHRSPRSARKRMWTSSRGERKTLRITHFCGQSFPSSLLSLLKLRLPEEPRARSVPDEVRRRKRSGHRAQGSEGLLGSHRHLSGGVRSFQKRDVHAGRTYSAGPVVSPSSVCGPAAMKSSGVQGRLLDRALAQQSVVRDQRVGDRPAVDAPPDVRFG